MIVIYKKLSEITDILSKPILSNTDFHNRTFTYNKSNDFRIYVKTYKNDYTYSYSDDNPVKTTLSINFEYSMTPRKGLFVRTYSYRAIDILNSNKIDHSSCSTYLYLKERNRILSRYHLENTIDYTDETAYLDKVKKRAKAHAKKFGGNFDDDVKYYMKFYYNIYPHFEYFKNNYWVFNDENKINAFLLNCKFKVL